MNAAHAPIFDFLVHIMLVRRSKTLIFLYFQKLRYLTSAFKRPGFWDMIGDIEAGLVNMVIVKDMSRFGRNYLEVGLYTEIRFPEMGVRFIAVNDGVDSDDQMGNDFTPFRNIINEWYAKDTSKKIRAVFRNKGMSGQDRKSVV